MEDHLLSRHAGTDHVDDGSSEGTATHKTRACANCARLKMKCQWPAAGPARSAGACSRCARMKLPCHVPEPSRKKTRGKSTRVAQLEKKIDGIVSLLAASKHIQANGPSPLTPESPKTDKHNCPTLSADTGPNESVSDPTPHDSTVFELIPGFRITASQAISYVEVYRQNFMPRFPFVVIPDCNDAIALHAHSHCLFWAVISAVAPQSPTIQHGVKKWFRRYIAEHVVVRQEKRLDLLQAMLVHLGWGDFHFYFDMHATSFLQLAMSLVIDLKLDRAPGFMHGAPRTLLGDAWSNMTRNNPKQKLEHTLPEKRAVLGFYHITTLVNTLFRRMPQLHWNSYLAQCCDSLAETREYPMDVYISTIVKMERATERVQSIMPSSDHFEEGSVMFRSTHDMAINAIRRELENIFYQQPDMIKQDKVFRAYYHILLMRLYEPVISMAAPRVSDSEHFTAEPFQRSEALWKCLQAAIDYFDTHLSISVAEIPSLPFTSTSILAFAIITASRLLLLDSSADWQSATARKKLDFADITARLSKAFEEGDKYAKSQGRRQRVLDDGSNVFYKYAYKFRWIRHWYLTRAPHEQHTLPEAEAVDIAAPYPDPNNLDDFLFDENFWEELISIHDPNLLNVPTHGPLQHSV